MSVCAITPTRGDRPELLTHCMGLVRRMIGVDQHIIVDYPPVSPEKDLLPRIIEGINTAKRCGHTHALIIEDDDFYPIDYAIRMGIADCDFTGDDKTMYYHIGSNGYQREHHPGRASLFTTGFRLSAIEPFNLKALKSSTAFLDIALWRMVRSRRHKVRFADSGAVGIKHGIGLTGGIGHRQKYYKFDPDWKLLASKVDAGSMEFYKDLHKQLNVTAI